MDVRRHPRIAERPDQNRVEIARQHRKAIGRNGGLVGEIAVRSPIEMGQRQIGANGLEHPHRLRNHFFADAVAGNYRNSFLCAHSPKDTTKQVSNFSGCQELAFVPLGATVLRYNLGRIMIWGLTP